MNKLLNICEAPYTLLFNVLKIVKRMATYEKGSLGLQICDIQWSIQTDFARFDFQRSILWDQKSVCIQTRFPRKDKKSDPMYFDIADINF